VALEEDSGAARVVGVVNPTVPQLHLPLNPKADMVPLLLPVAPEATLVVAAVVDSVALPVDTVLPPRPRSLPVDTVPLKAARGVVAVETLSSGKSWLPVSSEALMSRDRPRVEDAAAEDTEPQHPNHKARMEHPSNQPPPPNQPAEDTSNFSFNSLEKDDRRLVFLLRNYL
jgi:hypothetical protein